MTSLRSISYQSHMHPVDTRPERAVILVGHGSLRRASGASMIRLAARVRAAGVAPIVQAAFLNYSRPSVAEGVSRCVARGATDITVVPYFLVPGWFVKQTLPQMLNVCRASHPGITLRQTQALGDHPALAKLVTQRALEVDYLHTFPQIARRSINRLLVRSDAWQPMHELHRTGLLMIAHGSPDGSNNQPIYAVAERIREKGQYAAVTVCFMDLNRPSIAEAVDDFADNGIRHTIAVPYFLQLGNHVAEDLPGLIAQSRERHPKMTLLLAEHLGYDRLLVPPIMDRVIEVTPPHLPGGRHVLGA